MRRRVAARHAAYPPVAELYVPYWPEALIIVFFLFLSFFLFFSYTKEIFTRNTMVWWRIML